MTLQTFPPEVIIVIVSLFPCPIKSVSQWRLCLAAIALEGKEYVESGESVYLLCNTTEGSRVPDDVDWFKDGDKIDKQKYPHVVITKFRSKEGRSLISELIIERGRNTDSGTYICRSSLQQIASLEVTVLVGEYPGWEDLSIVHKHTFKVRK